MSAIPNLFLSIFRSTRCAQVILALVYQFHCDELPNQALYGDFLGFGQDIQ